MLAKHVTQDCALAHTLYPIQGLPLPTWPGEPGIMQLAPVRTANTPYY